jgi:hypothetical protein
MRSWLSSRLLGGGVWVRVMESDGSFVAAGEIIAGEAMPLLG